MIRYAVTAVAVIASGAPALAATFDFAQLANEEKLARGTEVAFDVAMPSGWTVDGITVRAEAESGSYVHLDGAHGKAVAAGLGVCEISDCNGDWHDGFTSSEILTLMFSDKVDMTSALFRESSVGYVNGRRKDHTLYSGGMFVNGSAYDVVDGLISGLGLSGTTFTFSPFADSAPAGGRVSPYLTGVTVNPSPSPVPVPAAALLLFAGLGSLGALRYRRRAAH